MLHPRALLLALSLALAGLSACAHRTDPADRARRVESGLVPPHPIAGEPTWTLAERMAHHDVPGLGLAVIDDHRVVWARGYGLADPATGRPVDPGTLFQAASISKAVHAVGVLRLVAAGRLALDRPVSADLRSWRLPGDDPGVTLRMLLSHGAGVNVGGFPGYPAGEPLPSLLDVLAGRGRTDAVRVDAPPGAGFRYSGGGVLVSQLLVQDVTGEPYPRLMQALVFDPLGMTSSRFDPPPAARAAIGHRPDGAPIPGGHHVYPELAAAGLWTTPTDLARLLVGLQTALAGAAQGSILPPALVREMLAPQFVAGPDVAVGLGMWTEVRGGARYFFHAGGNVGFAAWMVASEDGGRGVVVMINADSVRGFDILGEVTRAVARAYAWPGYVPAPQPTVRVAPDRLRALAGRWRFGEDSVATVRVAADRLDWDRDGETRRLWPVADRVLVRSDADVRLEFTGPELVVRYPDGVERASRLAPAVRVASELLWAGRVDEAVAAYRARFTADPADPVVAEARLNSLGYAALHAGRVAAAAAVFALNVALRPGSANARDSLADAHLAAGDTRAALADFTAVLAALAADTSLSPQQAAALRRRATAESSRLRAAPPR